MAMQTHGDLRYGVVKLGCILFLVFIVSFSLYGQGEWHPLIDSQQDFQKKAMLVLGGWGVVNAVAGGIGMLTTEGQTKYFHQMNAGWGIINAGIAAFGYYGAQNLDLSDPISISLLNQNFSLSKALLFNAGLDVGYIVGGLYLRERAKNTANIPERMKGFGNSIMIQGSFLFVFDLVAHHFNSKMTINIQDAILEMGSTDSGVGLLLQF